MQTAKPSKFKFQLHAPADMSEEQWAEFKDTAAAFVGATCNFAILLASVLIMGFMVFHIWS